MECNLAVPKKLGPWGRDTPPNWDLQLSPIETIKGVIIREGYIVDGIGFIVVDNDGKTSTKYFGGQGGNRHEIILSPDEFITHISGTYGEYYNNGVQIASIKIHTTHRTGGYGPYGKENGVSNIRQFSTTESLTGYVAVGFFGSASRYLDSIGFYIRKLKDRVKKHGPWGSQSPPNWESKLRAGETIKGVIIRAGYIVDGIGFIVVDDNGQTTTKYFGGQTGNRHEITLNSDELITHISGTYGEYSHSDSDNVIASIKIHTNSNPGGYGPYGEEIDVSNVRQFSITEPLSSFVAVGFFGRAGTYLDNIGFYINEGPKDLWI